MATWLPPTDQPARGTAARSPTVACSWRAKADRTAAVPHPASAVAQLPEVAASYRHSPRPRRPGRARPLTHPPARTTAVAPPRTTRPHPSGRRLRPPTRPQPLHAKPPGRRARRIPPRAGRPETRPPRRAAPASRPGR
eukprot:scaffold7258_cov122-Isochrysis_galbana.AAC.7